MLNKQLVAAYLASIGKKGGKAISAAKQAAARANGKKGGRPKGHAASAALRAERAIDKSKSRKA